MTKPLPKGGQLSPLGQQAEQLIKQLLADMAKDVKETPTGVGRRYSLVDQMRVLDRGIKLEAIKAKLEDDEGGFFGERDDDAAR